LVFGILPGLVVGSSVFHVAEVTVENAKSIGFDVSVVTSSTIPRTSARIAYPPEVEGVWAVKSVQIFYFDANRRQRFVQHIELVGKGNQPITFLFDKQDGESNVTALFTYTCIDENIRCDGWAHLQYHISSITTFEIEK